MNTKQNQQRAAAVDEIIRLRRRVIDFIAGDYQNLHPTADRSIVAVVNGKPETLAEQNNHPLPVRPKPARHGDEPETAQQKNRPFSPDEDKLILTATVSNERLGRQLGRRGSSICTRRRRLLDRTAASPTTV